MSSLAARFNAAVPWPLRYLIVIGVGLLLAYSVAAEAATLWAISVKLRGRAPDCPWFRILSLRRDLSDLFDEVEAQKRSLQLDGYDESLGIELLSLSTRAFWIRRQGHSRDGRELLAYLVADHKQCASEYPDQTVRPGDIVFDCGAHVGVFTSKALELGAEKVVAIDPDPTQVECLRRNFREEIDSGRVVVVPKGVWSSPGTMMLSLGTRNSGASSLLDNKGEQVEVAVTTIDRLVAALDLPRVDYIKLDIEGAEREALKGAQHTLSKYRPRLFIDAYHREDDMEVLPQIIREANPDYEMTCGPCEINDNFGTEHIVPHYVFYD